VSAIEWRASPAAAALATCSATALVVALVGGRPELLAFVAPMLGALAAGALLPRPVDRVTVRGEPTTVRLFEGESVRLAVAVDEAGSWPGCGVRALPQKGLEIDQEAASHGDPRTGVLITAGRWGRYRPRVAVDATAAGGLLVGVAVAEVATVDVFPLVDPNGTVPGWSTPTSAPTSPATNCER
jgi:uncharacterized protein (DUF58 family)